MSKKIRINDTVEVIAGDFKGQSGKVQEIDRKKSRLRVEGVKSGKKKTLKPNRMNPQGALIDRHEYIHISNVKVLVSEDISSGDNA